MRITSSDPGIDTLADRFLSVLNWLIFALSCLYAYSMLIHPWINGGWNYVHAVWLDWQSLNVGILAFLASVIAFNVSRYNAAQQRRRELVAARSFLPESLSELTDYFRKCGAILYDEYTFTKQPQNTPPNLEVPSLPIGYKEIFSRCISLADRELAEHLSYILSRLQIHHSRMCELIEERDPNSPAASNKSNILAYMFCLGELRALINNTYAYARGDVDFSSTPLDIESYKTAYANIGIDIYGNDDLIAFTRRAIKSPNN